MRDKNEGSRQPVLYFIPQSMLCQALHCRNSMLISKLKSIRVTTGLRMRGHSLGIRELQSHALGDPCRNKSTCCLCSCNHCRKSRDSEFVQLSNSFPYYNRLSYFCLYILHNVLLSTTHWHLISIKFSQHRVDNEKRKQNKREKYVKTKRLKEIMGKSLKHAWKIQRNFISHLQLLCTFELRKF